MLLMMFTSVLLTKDEMVVDPNQGVPGMYFTQGTTLPALIMLLIDKHRKTEELCVAYG
jgi:hypothetical protein